MSETELKPCPWGHKPELIRYPTLTVIECHECKKQGGIVQMCGDGLYSEWAKGQFKRGLPATIGPGAKAAPGVVEALIARWNARKRISEPEKQLAERDEQVKALAEAAGALAREARCVQQDGQDAREYNEELDVCATMTENAIAALPPKNSEVSV